MTKHFWATCPFAPLHSELQGGKIFFSAARLSSFQGYKTLFVLVINAYENAAYSFEN